MAEGFLAVAPRFLCRTRDHCRRSAHNPTQPSRRADASGGGGDDRPSRDPSRSPALDGSSGLRRAVRTLTIAARFRGTRPMWCGSSPIRIRSESVRLGPGSRSARLVTPLPGSGHSPTAAPTLVLGSGLGWTSVARRQSHPTGEGPTSRSRNAGLPQRRRPPSKEPETGRSRGGPRRFGGFFSSARTPVSVCLMIQVVLTPMNESASGPSIASTLIPPIVQWPRPRRSLPKVSWGHGSADLVVGGDDAGVGCFGEAVSVAFSIASARASLKRSFSLGAGPSRMRRLASRRALGSPPRTRSQRASTSARRLAAIRRVCAALVLRLPAPATRTPFATQLENLHLD